MIIKTHFVRFYNQKYTRFARVLLKRTRLQRVLFRCEHACCVFIYHIRRKTPFGLLGSRHLSHRRGERSQGKKLSIERNIIIMFIFGIFAHNYRYPHEASRGPCQNFSIFLNFNLCIERFFGRITITVKLSYALLTCRRRFIP